MRYLFKLVAKNRVFDENSFFEKKTMSKILENWFFGQRKAPAGWFHSKTKVVDTFPTIPDPNRTKLYLKISIFITVLVKIKIFN